MEYGTQYSSAPMQAAPAYQAGKRVRKDEIVGSTMVPLPGTQRLVAAAMAPTSYVTSTPLTDPYAAPRGVATEYGTALARPHSYGVGKVVLCGGGDAHQLPDVASNLPVRCYLSYSALSARAAVAGSSQSNQGAIVAQPRAPSTSANAPVRAYQAGLRDPYAMYRRFPPAGTPFTSSFYSTGAGSGSHQQ